MCCTAAASFHRRTRKCRGSTLGSPLVPAFTASLSHTSPLSPSQWAEYLDLNPEPDEPAAIAAKNSISGSCTAPLNALSKYRYWPGKPSERLSRSFLVRRSHRDIFSDAPPTDSSDCEEDIHTTCAELGREHCPYDADHVDSSILCEWKAKGLTNWMVRSTVIGAPFVTEGEEGMKGDGLAAADWLRMAFHESGQFQAKSWDGTPARGDDGSFWYETNRDTAPEIFAANAEMWEQTLDSREKVYRTVNRCHTDAAEACRYPCEEVCGYVDTTLFPGFNKDGSAASCSSGGEPEQPEPPEADLQAAHVEGSRAAAGADARGAGAATVAARRPVPETFLTAGRSAGATSAPQSARAARQSAGRGRRLLGRRRESHHDHSHHDDSYAIGDPLPEGFDTPFDASAARASLPDGEACYQQCNASCVAHFDDSKMASEPGYYQPESASSSGSGSGSGRVQCAVSFADVLQYAGAASVEVTGGPKLLRHVRSGRCDAQSADETFILPAPHSQSVQDMVDTIPFYKECQCAGMKHLVALMGSHTLGHAHSRKISDACAAATLPNTENARNMDTTPATFDNAYWKHVTRAECPRFRVRAERYDSCTAPYLTDAFAEESWPRLRQTTQSCAGDSFNNTVDTLWYDREGNTCDPDPVFRCANVTSINENTCSESVCPSGCVSPEESTECTCDPCGGPWESEALSDKTHCTGAATCGTFHSDQMLWATKETHKQVGLYARDQDAFFKNYAIAHVRMAHVGCEACGLGTDLTVDPCAAAEEEHEHNWRDRWHG